MSDHIALKDLLPEHGDVIGVIREELRSTLMRELDELAIEQRTNAAERAVRGAAFGEPVTCRFDHRILDAMVNTIAPELAKRLLELTVGRQFLAEHIDPSAVAVAIPLEDVFGADPLLGRLFDAMGPARAAVGGMDVQLKHGGGSIDHIPLSIVRWSRLVDAYRARAGSPALGRIEVDHVADNMFLSVDDIAVIESVRDPMAELAALEKK